MDIPEKEIDLELEAMTRAYQQYPEMLKNLQTPEYREYIRNMIGNRKVMDLIKTTCVERTNPEHKC
jgi:FKBP-type peptidyl-prolyl cis-trans isomerase (trigger factor)